MINYPVESISIIYIKTWNWEKVFCLLQIMPFRISSSHSPHPIFIPLPFSLSNTRFFFFFLFFSLSPSLAPSHLPPTSCIFWVYLLFPIKASISLLFSPLPLFYLSLATPHLPRTVCFLFQLFLSSFNPQLQTLQLPHIATN